MILHCPHCGIKVAPSTETCPGCTRRMVRSCPHCSERIAATAATCKYCGEGVESPRVAAPDPGIKFIEDARPAPKKRRCCRKLLIALTLLGCIVAAGLFVRADCLACSNVDRQAVSSTLLNCNTSHCGRKICRMHKTPLWISVLERIKGKVCCTKAEKPREY